MNFKKFVKDNYKFLLFMFFVVVFFYLPLPYYVMAPGGIIDVTDRVEMDDYEVPNKGSLNMLYVSEYDATPAYMFYSLINSNWDVFKNEKRQISNESISDVNARNKIMRDNSLDTAIMVAYKEAGKSINIKEEKNVVIATTMDNGLKVGDVILEVDGNLDTKVENVKKIINAKEEGEYVTFKVKRGNDIIEVNSRIVIENNTKIIGVMIIAEYDYDIDPEIDVKFKNSESGSSGGLMLTLTIYNAISDEDIIKGRNIAGTGTISSDGSVGVIDGIKYKLMGAVKNNMDIVFVPSGNYEEAISVKDKYNYNIEIVRVDTFDEAISYLKNN